MKVNVEIECTPEEARRLMGLPDFSPVHERYVAKLAEMTDGGVRPEAIEALLKSWSPLGETGMGLWRALIDAGKRKEQP